jgi:hypothetical protein
MRVVDENETFHDFRFSSYCGIGIVHFPLVQTHIFRKSCKGTHLMKMNLKTLTLLLGLTATQIVAQDLLAAPGTKWEQQLFGPSGNAQFSYGNGVFLTPDESEVVAVGTDGKVTAFAASDGAFSWDFEPPAVEEGSSYTIQSLSGMTFTTGNAASSYMIYSINYIAMADVVTDSDYT